MNIRSITAFPDVSYPLEPKSVSEAGEALRAAREALTSAGYTVQTTRLATQPFPSALQDSGPAKAVDFAKDLEALAFVHEIDYIGLGPVRIDDPSPYSGVIPEVLEGTEKVFLGIEIASREAGLSLPCARRAAETIRLASEIGGDGLSNMRLTAQANVDPWTPFLPAGYHGGGKMRIALATESADLAVQAVGAASSLAEARTGLIGLVEAEAERLESAVKRATNRFDVAFEGIDFSFAPFPEEARSIGAALEQLGLPAAGGPGSLMGCAFLTGALDGAQFNRTGFCGLMLPILEDSVLAARAAEGLISTTDLLAYSAVCGTGLDTIPLPGEVSEEALAAILFDVGALALRLDKPLTARLMPIPGKQAGDEVAFEFEYFTNTRVFNVPEGALGGLLTGDERVMIQPRPAGKR
jgi:uncharacterized protein (UPF0210 family)